MCSGGLDSSSNFSEETECDMVESSVGVEGVKGEPKNARLAWLYLTISTMFPGLEDLVMTVVTPAEVARRAATILVDMPPVPKAEPGVKTSASRVDISSTTSIG